MSFIISPYRFGGAGDPYFANVISLLHFDGANGSTTFTDVIGKTWTPTAAMQLSTTDPLFGTASGAFNGSNRTIYTADAADWNFGSGDFTIEAVARPDVDIASGGVYAIYAQWDGSNNRSLLIVLYDNGTNVGVQVAISTDGSSATNAVLGSVTWPANVTKHVAVCRAGGNIRAFIDGVQVGSTYNIGATALFNSTLPVSIGSNYSSGLYYFSGKIDEFRATKGVGRYTANFTPPAAPHPDS